MISNKEVKSKDKPSVSIFSCFHDFCPERYTICTMTCILLFASTTLENFQFPWLLYCYVYRTCLLHCSQNILCTVQTDPLGTWKANWKKSRPFQILFVLVILIEKLTSINREIDHNTFDWQGAESSPEIGFISRIMDFCLEYKCIPFSPHWGSTNFPFV